MRRFRLWLFALLVLLPLPLAAVASRLPQEDQPLLWTSVAWKHSPSFQRAEADPRFIFDHERYKADPVLWVIGESPGGRLESEPFTAPRWISLYVTGDLTRPGNNVYFRRVGQSAVQRVHARTEYYYWRRVTCELPSDWVGKPIQLLADAGPRTAEKWFGLSSPRALGAGTVYASHLQALAALPAFVLALALFFLPGLPVAARLVRRGIVGESLALGTAIVFSCLAGYLTFWAYFLHAMVGTAVGGAALIAGVAICILDGRRDRPFYTFLRLPEVRTGFALTALVGLFYVSIWLAVNQMVPFVMSPRLRFLEFVLTIDNELPYYLADRLYTGRDPRQMTEMWKSSDRPPLQTGLLLLQLPFGHLFRDPMWWSLVVAMALQCAWVPALRGLLRAAGLAGPRAGMATLLVVFTGFALVNTVFTWPKLLSAGLAVFVVTLGLFDRPPGVRSLPAGRALLIGLSAALTFLGHGGVAFTLLPLGLVLLWPRYWPGWRRVATAAAVFGVTLLPWLLYQRLYDPPGDRLLRQHFADRSRDREWTADVPLWKAVVLSYTDQTPADILRRKLANAAALARPSPRPAEDEYPWPPAGTPDPVPVDATALRRCEFMCLLWAPGLLNVGWLLAVTAAWRRGARPDPALGVTVPILVGLSALLWVALMFGPGTTVIHQGSYATVLLLLATLAAWIATSPGWLGYAVLAGQGCLFAGGWLVTSPANNFGVLNWCVLPFGLAFFALLVSVALAKLPADSQSPGQSNPGQRTPGLAGRGARSPAPR